MTGIPLLITFFLAIVLMIVAISKWKIHPFLSLMGTSLLLAGLLFACNFAKAALAAKGKA